MGSLKYWICANIILLSAVILVDVNLNGQNRFAGDKKLLINMILFVAIIIFTMKLIFDKRKEKKGEKLNK